MAILLLFLLASDTFQTVLERADQLEAESRSLRARYSWTETQRNQVSLGAWREKQYQNTLLEGTRYRRLTHRDGYALDPAEQLSVDLAEREEAAKRRAGHRPIETEQGWARLLSTHELAWQGDTLTAEPHQLPGKRYQFQFHPSGRILRIRSTQLGDANLLDGSTTDSQFAAVDNGRLWTLVRTESIFRVHAADGAPILGHQISVFSEHRIQQTSHNPEI
jgi:hypothetical protein